MSDIVEVKITGMDELQKKLEELPKKIGDNIFRRALKSAAKIVINAMVALAPKDTGFLSEHFGTRTRIQRQNIAGSIFIGPEGKIDYPDTDGGYRVKINAKGNTRKVGRVSVVSVARFLEYGTVKEKKVPFMSQAFEATKEQALNQIIDAIKDALK